MATLFDRILVERIRAGLESQRQERELLAGAAYRIEASEELREPMMRLADVVAGYDALAVNLRDFITAGEPVTASDAADIAAGIAAALRERGDLPELPSPPPPPEAPLGLRPVLANLRELREILARDESNSPIEIRLDFAISELSKLSN